MAPACMAPKSRRKHTDYANSTGGFVVMCARSATTAVVRAMKEPPKMSPSGSSSKSKPSSWLTTIRFVELIRDVLRETGLRAEYLELELTESLLLSNADVMFSTLQELKNMGVLLAIDDFGTGYSSFGYLRQFKVNRLKIARSFIQDVSVDPDDAAITTAIINMARALNLAVLAEGVENKEQLAFLQAQQCFTIQGFYFSKPVAVEDIDRHLRLGFSQSTPSSIQ